MTEERQSACNLPRQLSLPMVTNHLSLTTAFLIATHPNSETELTDWNQRTLPFSNRNTNAYSNRQTFSVAPCLRGQLALLRTSKITNHGSPITAFLIANLKLESSLTPSNQTIATCSNREKFQVPSGFDFKLPPPLSPGAAFSRLTHSHFLHSHRDACNIPPSKCISGVRLVERSPHVTAIRHTPPSSAIVSTPNQMACGRRMKK